jgi:hypothetical protein
VRARAAIDIGAVVAVKAAAAAWVWLGGFRAVSDDDFARVVLAQRWAADPKLDPTGTSWLPVPFWIHGGVMWLIGDTSLTCARVTSFALGLASAVLVWFAARLLVADRRAALAGALVAAAFPWSARLGVATVPELPTAALAFFAVASLASRDGGVRVAAAFALLAASLSRYEPWPLVIAFAVVSLWQARRAEIEWRAAIAAVVIATLGPAAWIAHNAYAHGEALHFLVRVSAYKRAVGGDDSLAVIGYALALLREEPELWIAAVACAIGASLRSVPTETASPWPRLAGALAFMVLALSLAAARGGAPTHHNGRALLAVWLALAVYVGAGLTRIALAKGHARIAVGLVSIAALPVGALVLRPWYARLDSMADREPEVAIGRAVRDLPKSARVLIEVRDFGFFAVEAGSGRPDCFIADRTLDPRDGAQTTSFFDQRALRDKLASTRATHVVAAPSDATAWLGEPIASVKTWRLWSVP